MVRFGLFALLLACAVGCRATRRQPGITIASAPPGARVVVDGRDTGFVTPCEISVSRDTHEVSLVLDGYQTAVRRVQPATRRDLIHYDEAYLSPSTWRFPLWLNYEDGLFPRKRDLTFSPVRIFVRMRLAGAG